jgi:poly-beta-1,6-N-acetyl-D-glucosamine synthase
MKQTKCKKHLPFKSLGLILSLYSLTALIFFLAFSLYYKPNVSFTTIRLVILIAFFPILLKYTLHLIIAQFYPLVNIFRKNINFNPTVSVIIPAYNEEIGITKTLQSVIDTKYPHLEIIVINDGSTDNTHKVITSYIKNIEEKHLHPNYDIIYQNSVNGGRLKPLIRLLCLLQ